MLGQLAVTQSQGSLTIQRHRCDHDHAKPRTAKSVARVGALTLVEEMTDRGDTLQPRDDVLCKHYVDRRSGCVGVLNQ